MGRQMPYYCEHGVCVDGGDFVDSEECNDCREVMMSKKRYGFDSAGITLDGVGLTRAEVVHDLNHMEAENARLRALVCIMEREYVGSAFNDDEPSDEQVVAMHLNDWEYELPPALGGDDE